MRRISKDIKRKKKKSYERNGRKSPRKRSTITKKKCNFCENQENPAFNTIHFLNGSGDLTNTNHLLQQYNARSKNESDEIHWISGYFIHSQSDKQIAFSHSHW